MRIPSYEDLAPSIPDVDPGDVLSVRPLLPSSGPVVQAGADARGVSDSQLFACLHAPRLVDRAVTVAKDFSPRYQRYGTDSVVMDVGGLGRLIGEAPAIGAELARAAWRAAPAPAARHLEPVPPPIRIAVAPTQVAALLLARAGTGLVVETRGTAAALARLPLDVLRALIGSIHAPEPYRPPDRPIDRSTDRPNDRFWPSWPACEQAFEVLARWGLRTLGEFTALPAGDLSARLGQAGIRLQQIARGIDPQPLVPEPDAPRYLERLELEWPLDGREPLSFVLARLLDPLTAALERADRAAAALRLELRLVDRSMHRRVLQLPAALRDARVFRTLLLLDLESHPPAAAIDVVSVEIDPAPARVLQYSLLQPPTASAETLATLTARLAALVGDARCGAAVLADSHRPDAFEMRRFAPDDRHGVPVSRLRTPLRESGGDRGGAAPAPLKGEEAMTAACLRRFRPPVAIRVTVDHGGPAHVAIDRRGMPGGRVEQSAGPWRTSGAWWSGPDESWNRDEWDVTFTDGVACRLFRDRDTGRWFMDAVID